MKMKCLWMVNEHIWGPLMRLLWVAVLVLPVFGAQGGVVLTTLHSFQFFPNGANPQAALLQGSDGYFYGTTTSGGTSNYGTVFTISTSGALTSLYSFTGGNDGGNPVAALVQGSDGFFYGTTEFGGKNDSGTVFKIDTNGALTNLYSFRGGNDGIYPAAALVEGGDGNFYGTAPNGGDDSLTDWFLGYGVSGLGTVFKISTNGALTSLYSFLGGDDEGGPNGLIRGSDGFFYGTTSGEGDPGTVFQISSNGALTTLYLFAGGNDGGNPVAALAQGRDGYFYGTTEYSDTNIAGTVFKIATNGSLTTLYSFTGGSDGGNPTAALVQGNDGDFYGTTSTGGDTNLNPSGYGTVFKISANGALTTLYSFTGLDDGGDPNGLILGSDGFFYGTTQTNDAGGGGTVFRLTIVPDPQLNLILSGDNMILTWPTNYGAFSYAGYTLQSTTNLASPVWTPISASPVVIGGENVVVNPVSGTRQFFRLSQ
jgi:uncharacterized repeat protein (TIGR03803 family)